MKGGVCLYSVLVVDHKKQMLSIYKNMVNWSEYGFEITTFASNEVDARAYFSEYEYDLIIIDIQLKQGDGLALLKTFKESKKNCNVIVCSYEEDFEMVRQAWKCGIHDYLRKSVLKQAQLKEDLREIREKLEEQHLFKESTWRFELQRCLGLIRDGLPFDRDLLNEILESNDLKQLKKSYRMLHFRLDHVRQNFWNHTIIDRDKLQLDLNRSIRKSLDGMMEYELIFSKKHAGILLLDPYSMKKTKAICSNIIKTVYSHTGYSISIAISKECKGSKEFYPEYIRLIEFIGKKFYTGSKSIVDMENPPVFEPLRYQTIHYHEQIMKSINLRKYQELEKIVKDSIDYMRKNQIQSEDVLQYYIMTIHHIELQELHKGVMDYNHFYEYLYNWFLKIEDLKQLEEEFNKMLHMIVNRIKEENDLNYNKPILQIMSYVSEHISEKITLEMISEEVHMSTVHISRIFKHATGKNLIQYINEEKMKKAIQLMKNENIKIKEVAQMIGMRDQLYFNKVFHKFYGMSPREYRSQIK